MSAWFLRPGASDLNSGSRDSDTALVTRDATGGTLVANVLTDAGVDFVAAGVLDTDAVNMQVGGADVRRKIAPGGVTATTLTLTGGAGNETYTGYRVGGAAKTIEEIVNSAAGKNAALASRDTVDLQALQTFVENTITVSINIVLRGNGATIDGTGGGAGSDVLNTSVLDWSVKDLKIINAVDVGFNLNTGGGIHIRAFNCFASACATGFFNGGGSGGCLHLHYCSARSCTEGANDTVSVLLDGPVTVGCDFSDNTLNGFSTVGGSVVGCLVEGNGQDGMSLSSVLEIIANCTIRGNVRDGVRNTNATVWNAHGGALFLNNVVAHNGGKGVNSTVAITVAYTADYNCFWSNAGGDRTNFATGTHDISSDPLFVSPSTSNFTPGAGSPLIGAGLTPMQAGNRVNIGAVVQDAVSSDLGWVQRYHRARKQYEQVGAQLRYRAYDPTDDATLMLDQVVTDGSGQPAILPSSVPEATAKSTVAASGDDAVWIRKVIRGRKGFELVAGVLRFRVYDPTDDVTLLVDQVSTTKDGTVPVLPSQVPSGLAKSSV